MERCAGDCQQQSEGFLGRIAAAGRGLRHVGIHFDAVCVAGVRALTWPLKQKWRRRRGSRAGGWGDGSRVLAQYMDDVTTNLR